MRPALLTVHLLATGLWLGGAALTLVGLAQGDTHAAWFAHDKLSLWASGLAALTGGLLCVFLPWGFVRFWWVVTKWAGTVLLALAQILWVGPALSTAAAHTDIGRAAPAGDGGLVAQALVGLGLVALVFVSLRKPWGRLRHSDKPGRTARGLVVLSVVLTVALSVAQVVVLDGLRATAVADVPLAGLDGRTCRGRVDQGGGFAVELDVAGGRIAALRVTARPDMLYPALGALVADRVTGGATLQVDGVTGATTSSRMVLKAAEVALRGCR